MTIDRTLNVTDNSQTSNTKRQMSLDDYLDEEDVIVCSDEND